MVCVEVGGSPPIQLRPPRAQCTVWVVRGSREQNSEALTLAAPGRPMMEDSDIEIRPVFEMEDFGESMTEELREQEDRLRARIEEK